MNLQRTSQPQPPSAKLPLGRTHELAIIRDAASGQNVTENRAARTDDGTNAKRPCGPNSGPDHSDRQRSR